MRTLHVVMPVYNEPATLAAAVGRVLSAPMPTGWQVRATLVDDGSDGATKAAIAELATRPEVATLAHPQNRGKGAAIRTGFAHVLASAAEDDAILIQDADLEYDPADFPALLAPLVAGHADLVLGNRWATPPKGLKRLAHRLLNGFLTLASNLTTGLAVHDMECCYKLFTVPAMRRVIGDLDEERFGEIAHPPRVPPREHVEGVPLTAFESVHSRAEDHLFDDRRGRAAAHLAPCPPDPNADLISVPGTP
jgi:glycosyltransferase involved in cell wall biosynthesis